MSIRHSEQSCLEVMMSHVPMEGFKGLSLAEMSKLSESRTIWGGSGAPEEETRALQSGTKRLQAQGRCVCVCVVMVVARLTHCALTKILSQSADTHCME